MYRDDSDGLEFLLFLGVIIFMVAMFAALHHGSNMEITAQEYAEIEADEAMRTSPATELALEDGKITNIEYMEIQQAVKAAKVNKARESLQEKIK